MTHTSATQDRQQDAPPWRALYPFESHFLPVDEHSLHYLDEGPQLGEAPRAPVVLFSHGNPTWSFHWRNLITDLRDDFRAVAPDHLGCGLSDKPQQMFRLADRVRHMQMLIEQLDLQRITLVAQDWGGAIGLGAALEMPERFERFVLLNTGAFVPWFFPRRIRVCRFPVLGRVGVQGLNLFSRAALRMTMSHPERLSPAIRAGYLAPYDSWSNRAAVYNFVEDIPWSASHPSRATLAEIERRLPQLASRPVQLIWGMRDWCFTPACLDRFVEIFPQAETHRFEDAGHWIVEDSPERVTPLVRAFLEQPLANTAGVS
ncbi:MAG: alpha/beta fold hydrolase [Planctomycetales bacterium]|nr:alpha/beta fold hydrolase [Planctomycetales bacterium]